MPRHRPSLNVIEANRLARAVVVRLAAAGRHYRAYSVSGTFVGLEPVPPTEGATVTVVYLHDRLRVKAGPVEFESRHFEGDLVGWIVDCVTNYGWGLDAGKLIDVGARSRRPY